MLEGGRELVLHDHGVPWYRLLLQKDIVFLGLQYFGFSYTWYFYVTWLPTWLQQARGPVADAGGGLCHDPAGAAAACGSIVSGFLPLSVPRKWVAICGFFATAALIFIIPSVPSVDAGHGADGRWPASASDLTMPISWNTCVEIGKQYTATVSSTMNMLGNFAGFVAPVVFGLILQDTNNNWAMVMYTMAAAAIVSGHLLVVPGARRQALILISIKKV